MAFLTNIKSKLKVLNTFKENEEGVAAVEFSLTFPIYLGVIILVVEMARLIFTFAIIMHAAEEATRHALVNYDATPAEIQTFAQNSMVGLDPDNLTAIIVTAPVDAADQTKLITVEVQYDYVPILPIHKFVDAASENGFALTGQSKGFLTEEIPDDS